jgi:hypothetical protein
MKYNKLPSQEYLQECFEYNRETGELFWKTRPRHHFKNDGIWKMWNTSHAGKKISNINDGYLTVGIDLNVDV